MKSLFILSFIDIIYSFIVQESNILKYQNNIVLICKLEYKNNNTLLYWTINDKILLYNTLKYQSYIFDDILLLKIKNFIINDLNNNYTCSNNYTYNKHNIKNFFEIFNPNNFKTSLITVSKQRTIMSYEFKKIYPIPNCTFNKKNTINVWPMFLVKEKIDNLYEVIKYIVIIDKVTVDKNYTFVLDCYFLNEHYIFINMTRIPFTKNILKEMIYIFGIFFTFVLCFVSFMINNVEENFEIKYLKFSLV